jgi:threonine/homoserine/homoserine lactone efflux protein
LNNAMLGIHDFALFVAAGLLLNITPGPDLLYVVGRSTAQGARAGAAAALGIGVGCFVHIAAAALGLSAILAASATAFSIVKIVGAAYLVYVGLSILWNLRKPADSGAMTRTSLETAQLRTVFTQGFLTNALNPKVALFFLAFVPQFIDADAANKALAFLLLGLVFNFTGTIWNLLVAWFTARTLGGLRASRAGRWLNGCIGATFVYLGVRLALAKQG